MKTLFVLVNKPFSEFSKPFFFYPADGQVILMDVLSQFSLSHFI